MQKITPCLWFDSQAEEAANFYCSLFEDSKILAITRYSEAASKMSGRPPGSVLTVKFQLAGQEYLALNGGPHFKLSEAFSLIVNCDTQAELDKYWEQLSAGGEKQPCGWLKDKYGLSWQVVPTALEKMLSDPDSDKADRVMNAVLAMQKLDIAALERARGEA